ncbi:fused MFS/spermidine synthase [Hydrocarboniphaga effusa]|uniref:PABS domain-containing protein n=1 Tax=Hydrocarboniphaga effusa AP103 TaxID=1172194 RepID=I7ZAX4_9GAMM|nr:fused MFS/spermidine synthase [Hydrocarboniphaga effusa]EIT68827.1 hypothetical protein WQQ_24090 [Hydrocarboniphaga effusa AP103]
MWRVKASLLVMAASGFAGLGYQIVWTQQCALWLGHESASVLAVVGAFFGGLAAGALLFGSRIEASAKPLRWYVGCELAIAAWSLVLALAMPWMSDGLLGLIGAQPSPPWQWAVAFAGSFLLLLPATAAMGATLPAMEKLAAQWQRRGRSIAPLYASNTVGAVCGVLAIAFWLAPELGLRRTAAVCIALNLLCAFGAASLFPQRATAAIAPAGGEARQARSLLIRLAATGLLGIGFEVLVVRVLSEVAEDTVYTFALLLAVYLVGSALGAAVYQRLRSRVRDAERFGDALLAALAVSCLLGTASLWYADALKQQWLALFGFGMRAALSVEALLALGVFALPTLFMGAVFSDLSNRAHAAGVPFGRVLGVNTLGAAAAPPLFGVLALPMLGPKFALLLLSAGYLALIAARRWRSPMLWLPAGVASLLGLLAPALAIVEVPEGGHVVEYRDGVMAAVSVVEDAQGVRRLRLDNRQQEGSSASLRVDGRQAWLPMLLHPQPRRALFLGLGTGVTASTAALDTAVEVDAVELLPEVIDASKHFADVVSAQPNPRLHRIAADARRYVRASERRYDVVVADNFHPARSGSGSLYTVEHFAAVRERLSDDGLFCQWLPLHQLDNETLRSIVQSFVVVYPHASAMFASNSLQTPVLGLVGRRDDGGFDFESLGRRLASVRAERMPAEFGIEDEFALLGGFVAGPAALKAFAGTAPANTDDHPVVAYRAPAITYAPDSLPGDRMIELLRQWRIEPRELLGPAVGADPLHRLAAYWRARDRFVESGRAVQPSPDARRMLAQVREPLLEVLRTSADFRPAYDPLLSMARTLAAVDERAARNLLERLAELAPARAEAPELLEKMAPPAP